MLYKIISRLPGLRIKFVNQKRIIMKYKWYMLYNIMQSKKFTFYAL